MESQNLVQQDSSVVLYKNNKISSCEIDIFFFNQNLRKIKSINRTVWGFFPKVLLLLYC